MSIQSNRDHFDREPKKPGGDAEGSEEDGHSRPYQLLVLSAQNERGLELPAANLSLFLQTEVEVPLADVAYTLAAGRPAKPVRRAIVCRDVGEALQKLHEDNGIHGEADNGHAPGVVFMFADWQEEGHGLSHELYAREPDFAFWIDHCVNILKRNGLQDLRETLFNQNADDAQTPVESPPCLEELVLFVTAFSLAQLWRTWGVQPGVLIGYGLGEYAAACLAEIFSLEDALRMLTARRKIMLSAEWGRRLSVNLPESELASYLSNGLMISAVNEPGRCVVEGRTEAVTALHARLEADQLACHSMRSCRLRPTDKHDPRLKPFTDILDDIHFNRPTHPCVSSVTGRFLTPGEAENGYYWLHQLFATQRFALGLETLLGASHDVFLEVGPGRTATTFAARHDRRDGDHLILPSLPLAHVKQDGQAQLLETLGLMWCHNVSVDWEGFYHNENRCCVPLPGDSPRDA